MPVTKNKNIKTAYCKVCKGNHPRPVGKGCVISNKDDNISMGEINSDSSRFTMQHDTPTDPMTAILSKLDDMQREQQFLIQRLNKLEDGEIVIPSTSSPIQPIRKEQTYQGKSSIIKTGRFRTADTQVNNYIQWPQEYVYVGPSRKTIPYDDLNFEQFTLGFIRIAQQQKPQIRDIMYDYLADLTQSSLDSGSFDLVRGAHSVVLQEMERGVISWLDVEEVNRIRLLYTNKAATSANSFRQTGEIKRVVCTYYNNGKCKHLGDHQRKNLMFRHICTYCYKNYRKALNHTELSCQKQQKSD